MASLCDPLPTLRLAPVAAEQPSASSGESAANTNANTDDVLADQLREAMKARMPPIHPAGYSEPIPDVARIAGGLVAHVARGGPPVINPATPPDPEALAAMQAQADRERAAMAARDAATAPPTLEERVARLEATVARLTSR